jgi:hypothetical protein
MIPKGFSNLPVIRRAIRAMYRHFGRTYLAQFQEGIQHRIPLPLDWTDSIIDSQRLARQIALHFKLTVESVIVSFDSSLPNPGRVELTPSNIFFVDLNAAHKARPNEIAAILAHEVAHIFLHRNRLSFPLESDNEILTDTAAAYLGAGVLSLGGYCSEMRMVDSYTTQTQTSHFGYLTPDEFGFLLAKRQIAFGDDPSDFVTHEPASSALAAGQNRAEQEWRTPPLVRAKLLAEGRYALGRWLAGRRSSHRRSIASAGAKSASFEFEVVDGQVRVVFHCPVCYQKLRMPCSAGSIVVRCPVCESRHECRT